MAGQAADVDFSESKQLTCLQVLTPANYLFFKRTALDECVSIDIAENTRLRFWEVIDRKQKGKKTKTIHRPNRESENLEGNGDFAEHMNHVLQKKMDELIAEQI